MYALQSPSTDMPKKSNDRLIGVFCLFSWEKSCLCILLLCLWDKSVGFKEREEKAAAIRQGSKLQCGTVPVSEVELLPPEGALVTLLLLLLLTSPVEEVTSPS